MLFDSMDLMKLSWAGMMPRSVLQILIPICRLTTRSIVVISTGSVRSMCQQGMFWRLAWTTAFLHYVRSIRIHRRSIRLSIHRIWPKVSLIREQWLGWHLHQTAIGYFRADTTKRFALG